MTRDIYGYVNPGNGRCPRCGVTHPPIVQAVPDRPEQVPFEETPCGLLMGLLVLLTLFLGIPFLFWLVAS